MNTILTLITGKRRSGNASVSSLLEHLSVCSLGPSLEGLKKLSSVAFAKFYPLYRNFSLRFGTLFWAARGHFLQPEGSNNANKKNNKELRDGPSIAKKPLPKPVYDKIALYALHKQ